MYFSAKDKGEMMSMIYNWPGHQVDMIVLTDGSRILGLGDLGVQGIGIPIGKLDMYVAAAGINPHIIRREDLGLRQPWLEGEEYLSFVDEFMEAIHTCWLKAIVQGTAVGRGLVFLTWLHKAASRMWALRTTMANPTMNAECTAVDAFNHARENIVLQAGALSKMLTLFYRNGKVGHVKQANNTYLFPGIGMGAFLSGARLILDGMSLAASECIRDITAEVEAPVVRAAVAEELAEGRCDMGPRELRGGDGGICQTQHVVSSLEPSGS
ncbi:unnamed protein product [Camellia sinensis]